MEDQNQYNQHLIGIMVIAIVFGVGFAVGISSCKLFF